MAVSWQGQARVAKAPGVERGDVVVDVVVDEDASGELRSMV